MNFLLHWNWPESNRSGEQFQTNHQYRGDQSDVTLWMMILQRLREDMSLDAIVKEILSKREGLLPDNKRVRENTLSESTGADSDARTRLRLETIEFSAERVYQSLIAMSPRALHDRLVFILDGTTMTLAPTRELKAAFPTATNQFGDSVWPVAMLLVAHEMQRCKHEFRIVLTVIRVPLGISHR